jgi:predicted nucleotide-binding protein
MARKPTNQSPQRAELSLEEMERGVRRLEKRLKEVEDFDPKTLDPQDPYSTVRPISQSIVTALSDTFGPSTIEYARFRPASVLHWPIMIGNEIPHYEKIESVSQDRQRSIQLLTAAIELLKERIEEQRTPLGLPGEPTPPLNASNKIFVVHGHDNEPKEAVARFLSQLGYEPIILHEQPNRGRTIIQKFRDEASDVGFAVVLVTGDDETADGKRRARQNVILELGFFLGRLGPERVVAIVKGQDVERPSDFDGVIYTPFDPDWRSSLAKELDAAGYEVDWNVVMKRRA